MVLAAWWAAIWSGGRSSFTPVAVGFAVAIGLAVAQRARRHVAEAALVSEAVIEDGAATPRPSRRRFPVLTALAGGVFVVAVALLYGSTLAPSPRDGVQPIEKTDMAFYAVLGRDLAATGTETSTLLSGFSELPGAPAQLWYHWGELWLASAIIRIFGTAPMLARYIVVLPLLLLAAAALTGTLVRRMGRTTSRRAFLFGFLACLVLAPMPLITGPYFSVWHAGMIVLIAAFGLAAVAVLFGLYSLAMLGKLRPTWPTACFVGCAVALILPAHIVIALLGLIGVGAVWAKRIGFSLLAARRQAPALPIWRRTAIVTLIALSSSVGWGLITGHGIGGGGSMASLSPFTASWRDSIVIVTLEAGLFLAIPFAWLFTRRDRPVFAETCLATMALLVTGAIAWGWGYSTLSMFYFFFGGIAVFATPIAAVATWLLLKRMRTGRHPRLAVGIVALCVVQLELGVVLGLARLQGGSPDVEPIPVNLLAAIEQLPADAKLAYACQPLEEVSFVNSKLLGIDAHTGRRVVPMCFEADVIGPLFGAPPSTQMPDAGFASAPQLTLYPNSAARPSSLEVAAFLKAHSIDYIYADSKHPNSLVAGAVPIAAIGQFAILRIP